MPFLALQAFGQGFAASKGIWATKQGFLIFAFLCGRVSALFRLLQAFCWFAGFFCGSRVNYKILPGLPLWLES